MDIKLTETQLLQARTLAESHDEIGQEAWVAHTRVIGNKLEDLYRRPGLCLKLFVPNPDPAPTPGSHLWGGTPLGVATRVQNLFALHGLAPRVYALVTVNGEQVAQVLDYVEAEGAPDTARAERVAEKYGISIRDLQKSEATRAAYIARPAKWRGKRLVDFGRFGFADVKQIEKRLREHVATYHKKDHHGEMIGYQPCPELGIEGKRDVESRRIQMGLDAIDWRGVRALDLGCNQGAFTRLMDRLGAARVVGVDHKFARGNAELANWLGAFRCDFLELSLPGDWRKIEERTGIASFDVVLCLSVLGHAGGYASWFPKLVAPGGIVLFEGQGRDKRESYQALLERDFAKVEWLGEVRDHGVHPLWRCTKAV